MSHDPRTAARCLAACAAAALVLAACGTSEPQATEEVPTRLASYELATGEQAYEASVSMQGTMGFGEAMRAAAGPSAAALAQDTPVSMQLTMVVTQTVAEDDAGRKVTLHIEDADGHVKAFGVDQDIDQQMLQKSGSTEITYTMSPDGSTDSSGGQVNGLGLGMLGGANVGGSCPRIPEGGVESGQEWKTSQQVPVAGVQATIPSTNTYTLDGDTGTVTSRTDGPIEVSIDFAEFAKSTPSLASAGNLSGVTMHMVGTANMTSTCVLTLPAQELESVESTGHLSIKMSLAGTANNPQLAQIGEGEFMHLDADSSSSMHQA